MQSVNVSIEMLVHLYAVAVELQLRRVQKGLAACEAWYYAVHRLDEVDDVRHRAVGHCGGDVAGNGVGKGGLYV